MDVGSPHLYPVLEHCFPEEGVSSPAPGAPHWVSSGVWLSLSTVPLRFLHSVLLECPSCSLLCGAPACGQGMLCALVDTGCLRLRCCGSVLWVLLVFPRGFENVFVESDLSQRSLSEQLPPQRSRALAPYTLAHSCHSWL